MTSAAVMAQQSRQGPVLLSYEELVQLYEQPTPAAELQGRLQLLLTTPFVNNDASDRGVKPILPNTPKLGKVIRVIEWNIERGLEYEAIKSAFTDVPRFTNLLDSSSARGGEKRTALLQQLALLKQADVVVLAEVDWGMKRTEYRNVAADLAAALNMNYAYGVEFVEVDPIALGTEKFEELKPSDQANLAREIGVDRSRYRGLHGTAILSRFRLENVKLEPFTHQPHNWYEGELKSVKPLEAGKRKAGELVFREKVQREVRRGGRMMLTAEISDERIPGGRMSIVATHLESKTKPEGRRKQLEELLARIKNTNVPVVLAGDMNTSTHDATPTSIRRELKKRLGSKSFWIKQGLSILTGIKLPTLLLGGLNSYRTQADPTVRNVPLVASNPEAEFFERLKDFRFSDTGAFDFRGERQRSIGAKTSPLANSNQRGDKGFITTYEYERTIGFVGRFKLDWIFVKPPVLTEPYAKDQPYRFAPHFGRTLKALNEGLKDRISDHSPIMLDLPLAEPQLEREKLASRGNRSFRGGLGSRQQGLKVQPD
jgi:endonuclease/exonuclease/phosphatase family metal-dependent hydrolase